MSNGAYDPKVALDTLYYSKVAYCNDKHIESWTCGVSCNYHKNIKDVKVVYNNTHQTQGYTGYDPDRNSIIVAFRGSATAINWYEDFNFEQVPYARCSGCKIHKGFDITYKDVGPQLMAQRAILEQKYGQVPTIVTGHSLGAAIALLHLAELLALGKKINYFYHFAAPRLGNVEFATFVNSKFQNTFRVVHYKDPVPHLPFKDTFGYVFRHEPTEIWYNTESGTGYQVCTEPGVQESKTCSNAYLDYIASDHTKYLGISTECT